MPREGEHGVEGGQGWARGTRSPWAGDSGGQGTYLLSQLDPAHQREQTRRSLQGLRTRRVSLPEGAPSLPPHTSPAFCPLTCGTEMSEFAETQPPSKSTLASLGTASADVYRGPVCTRTGPCPHRGLQADPVDAGIRDSCRKGHHAG